MECPACNARLPILSRHEIECPSCKSSLRSENSKLINIWVILLWGISGKIFIINQFDSIIVGLTVILITMVPIIIVVRKLLVKYSVKNPTESRPD